ncbi:UPF0187-domain-containing protein [Exidia glandulosa HHB12029]|uniref:UPF0187-domain-containing protein n=1 Tax=Exidia glandulosa HHB12029 TaxID=1314781 RepID=A0A165ZR56_EXIGL|nr:UPF0187-domain-containing protein [Exidia glandulosa HHB12029]
MTSTVKSMGGMLPIPVHKLKREHLRKYSWLPDVLRYEGSVIRIIVGPVLTVTFFATAVALAHFHGYQVALTNAVTPLLGVVVGLILVFRNGTSYDRYYEGRKDFGQMMSNIRNLARLVWVNVSPPGSASETSLSAPATQADLKGGKSPRTSLHAVKVRTLRLLVAYAVAVKHHLRDEPGPHWQDFKGLLPHRFAHEIKGYSGLEDSIIVPQERSNKKSRRQQVAEGADDLERGGGSGTTTPLLTESQHSADIRRMLDNALPLPLVIGHEITRLLLTWRSMGYLDAVGPAGLNAMNQLLQGMVDQLTAMERIATTPIPASYGIHLKQCVTLYLFALPFTLVNELRWNMIPVVTLVAFTLMGIEGIAQEIEMPFGRDESDLPLDEYCEELKEEIEYIITRLPEGSAQDGSLLEDDDDL